MPKKTEVFSPIKTGYDPRTEKKAGAGEGGGSIWVKIEDGKFLDVIPLVTVKEIITIEQCAIWRKENSPVWTYTGEDDPSHILNIQRALRSFLPVLVLEDGKLVDEEPKIFSMSKTVHGQLLETADSIGKLKGQVLRIKRTGKEKQTRYSINSRGMKFDVSDVAEVDVIPLLGPLDTEGVQKLIYEKFECDDWEDFLEVYLGKAAKKEIAAKAKPKAKKPVAVEVEDEEEDELIPSDEEEEEEEEDIDALELT